MPFSTPRVVPTLGRAARLTALLVAAAALTLAAFTARADAAQTLQLWATPSTFIASQDLKDRDLDNGKLSTRVVLPDGYTSRKCWPVMYLLHGTGTDTTPAPKEWIDQMHADTAGSKAILVIPGGGPMWWSNQWWGGLRRPAFENWVLQELIPLVEKKLNVCAGRSQHAIAGYSMGGYGAALLGSERPDYFGAVGSFSGVLEPMRADFSGLFSPFVTNWGPVGGFYAAGHDPVVLMKNLRHTRLFVSAGDGNPVADETITAGSRYEELLFSSMSNDYAKAAKKAGIAVTMVNHPGGHTWITWQQDLARITAWNPFKPVPAKPASWSYTTIATQGVAWNYTFAFKKPPTQLLKLERTGATLKAYGAGTLTLKDASGKGVTAKLPFTLRGTKVGKLRNPKASVPTTTTRVKVTPKISPTAPGASDPITVSFTTAETLPAGKEYGIALLSTSGGCSQTVSARVSQPAKGKLVSVVLRPDGDPANPRTTWCPGAAAVGLVAVDKGAALTGGEILGYVTLTLPAAG
jgi:S-formylglutathione hydrolase FrmB